MMELHCSQFVWPRISSKVEEPNERIVVKRINRVFAIGVATILALGATNARASVEVSASVSVHAVADFYAPLTPHGEWLSVGSYGRCWHPASLAVECGPIVTAIGCGLIVDGTGKAMSHGPGLVTTTARGCMTRFISGCGCRASNGLRRGFHGALAVGTSAGRLCLLLGCE